MELDVVFTVQDRFPVILILKLMKFNFSHLKMASRNPLFRNKKIFLVLPLGLNFGEALEPLVKLGAVRASSIMKHSEGKVQIDPLLIEPSTQLYFGSYTDLLNVSETITFAALGVFAVTESEFRKAVNEADVYTQLAGYSKASVLAMTASEYASVTARLLQQVRQVFSCPVGLVLSPELVKNKKEKNLFSGPGWMSTFFNN